MTISRAALFAFALAATGVAGAQPAPVHHEISVSVDPQARALRGRSTASVALDRPFEVRLSQRFAVEAFSVDGETKTPARTPDGAARLWRIEPRAGARRIEVRWSGPLAALDPSIEHRQTLGRAVPVSGAQGTFLPQGSGWYPEITGEFATYDVSLELPAGQIGLVPGKLIEEALEPSGYRARFELRNPADSLALMAGPYRVDERRVKTATGTPVRLRTYFHPGIAELAAGYLDSVQGYLDLYEGWIGAYPFSEFSVVSSPTPTGFGMPTLTYLGIEVLKLPFIRATSLGHEVLHNWWGNAVYPDYARGNWSEGLTTFMADYAYRERESAAAAKEMRLGWLRDISAVPPGEDLPLRAFVARSHGISQIVGYNKPAQMFVMLRDLIGRDAFDAGVRMFWREHRFRVAGWGELQRAFEAASGRALDLFFAQWLERHGAPAIRIASARVQQVAGGWRVSVTLSQDSPTYELRIPVVVRTERGEETRVLELARTNASFTLETAARPQELVLDPELRVLRRLAPSEAPPILRQAMIDPALVTVFASAAVEGHARQLAPRLLDHPLRVAPADARPGTAPLFVIGLHAEIDAWLARHGLPPRPQTLAGKGTAQVWTAARPGAGPLTAVSARDAQSLAQLARPLPHYGRQSFVVFEGARAMERGTWPTRPQLWRFP